MAISEVAENVYAGKNSGYLDELVRGRQFTHRAARKAASTLFKKYLPGLENVLEVGSGIGYFRTLVPEEFKGKWTQFDGQPTFLKESRKQKPNDTYLTGAAEALPFAEGSFDVVLGFNSYDLVNLSLAVEEAHRVLRHGGYFFSIHDLSPSITEFIKRIKVLNLPHAETGIENVTSGLGYTRVFRYVPKENVHAFEAAAERLLAAESANQSDLFDSSSIDLAMKREEKLFKQYGITIKMRDFQRCFQQSMLRELDQRFATTWSGHARAITIGKKNQTQKDFGASCNLFIRYGGFKLGLLYTFGLSSSLDRLPLPSTIEMIDMPYIAARK